MAVFLETEKLPFSFYSEVDKLNAMKKPILREHKHVIVRAYVNNPPREAIALSDWCCEVIDLVGMKVIGGPLVVYSDMEGNKGHTAVAILDFSHLSIHVWDEVSPSLIEFDLFSCGEFDPQIVIDKINKDFQIVKHNYMILDRDSFDNNMVDI